MIDQRDKALLPTGLSDGLPPDAAFEAGVRERLVAAFVARGFDRVSPPLAEFEDSLLAGTGAAMAADTFRLMDPVSQRMMGLRADITPQIARLATTRLAHVERPLRLCYAGEVLRVRGTQLRPERQFTQAGAELIGTDNAGADAEMVLMAADALAGLGIDDIKVDICQPTLAPLVMTSIGFDGDDAKRVRAALDRKDAAEVATLSKELADDARGLLSALLEASGPAEKVSHSVRALPLQGDADRARNALLETLSLIADAAPDLDITIDAVENRGFEYHTGVTFTLFARGVRGELGSGGRYLAGQSDTESGEPATGFTLFLDSILRAIAAPQAAPKIYLPAGTSADGATRLRREGYRTVQGFTADADASTEARRLGCTHVFDGTAAQPLEKRG